VSRLPEPFLAALLVAIMHALVLVLGEPAALEGRLPDSDCYARLMRIEALLLGGGWYDGLLPLLNAPDGLVMHWTRPFDLVVILVALPLMVFLPLGDALLWAGVFVSPLLHMMTAALLAWGARPLLGRGATLLAVAMFVMQPSLYGVFQAGRADHHSLHLLLAMAVLALLLRWTLGQQRCRWLPAAAGACAALGLWVGSEALLTIAVGGLALGAAWLAGRNDGARALWQFALTLALGIVLAVAIERPPSGWVVAELDRISSIQVLLGATLAGAAGVVFWFQGRRSHAALVQRLAVACLAALIPALAMGLLAPEFFAGPYGAVDEAVREVFLINVQEAEPLFDRGRTTMANVLFNTGPLILAMPFAVIAVLRRPRQRAAWLLLVVAMAVFLVASLQQIRVLPYLQMALVVPWSGAVIALTGMVFRALPRPWRGVAAAFVLLVTLFGHIFAGALLLGRDGLDAVAAWRDNCDWTSLGRDLRLLAPDDVGGTIATMVFPGPELAWRSGLGVVSAPYHRNAEGIIDVHRLFLADEALARSIAADREVALIVMCRAAPGRGGHAWYVERAQPEGLYARLAAGDLPAWIGHFEDDRFTAEGFEIFRVGVPN
jgi:asparagine N-glycosylation enzyme membrane subunit Stt3